MDSGEITFDVESTGTVNGIFAIIGNCLHCKETGCIIVESSEIYL